MLKAYVDGSFDKVQGAYGTGVVVLKDGQVIKQASIRGANAMFVDSYQIAGEVIGCLYAVDWAKKNGFNEIEIYYDYMGIEMWATGKWKTNKPVSQYYAETYKRLSEGMKVTFFKVKAHTGDFYNERADELAKASLKN
jgi:ribonuclease HI